jgi:hypothetical protein
MSSNLSITHTNTHKKTGKKNKLNPCPQPWMFDVYGAGNIHHTCVKHMMLMVCHTYNGHEAWQFRCLPRYTWIMCASLYSGKDSEGQA